MITNSWRLTEFICPIELFLGHVWVYYSWVSYRDAELICIAELLFFKHLCFTLVYLARVVLSLRSFIYWSLDQNSLIKAYRATNVAS